MLVVNVGGWVQAAGRQDNFDDISKLVINARRWCWKFKAKMENGISSSLTTFDFLSFKFFVKKLKNANFILNFKNLVHRKSLEILKILCPKICPTSRLIPTQNFKLKATMFFTQKLWPGIRWHYVSTVWYVNYIFWPKKLPIFYLTRLLASTFGQ